MFGFPDRSYRERLLSPVFQGQGKPQKQHLKGPAVLGTPPLSGCGGEQLERKPSGRSCSSAWKLNSHN
ncbi:hypothetical protein VULLAG_LOCUS13010 [Vulpes lagopus]